MDTSTNPTPHRLTLTASALQEIRDSFQTEQIDTGKICIRIGAKPGGCTGYKYTMEIADIEHIGASDSVFESAGICLVVDTACMEEVMGSVEIDFKNGDLVDQGFVFRQLQSTAQCGCGQSFAPIKPADGTLNPQ